MPSGGKLADDDHGWTFVTNHLIVLLCIAGDPTIRMADVAVRVGLTERAVQGIVADLEEEGYLTRRKVGRRNHYEVNRTMPLRQVEVAHHQVGELLSMFAAPKPERLRASKSAPRRKQA